MNNSKQSAKFSKLINKNRDINWVDLESHCTQITTVRPDPTESFNECIGHLVHWTTTAGKYTVMMGSVYMLSFGGLANKKSV